jgi:hypothetical protein
MNAVFVSFGQFEQPASYPRSASITTAGTCPSIDRSMCRGGWIHGSSAVKATSPSISKLDE